MSQYTAQQVHLKSRPAGMPTHDNFALVTVELPQPAAGEVLVKNLYMSVDPYMRGRMREDAVYAQAYAVNEVMYGGAIGEVIESNDPSLSAGDIVLNQKAWQDRFVAPANTRRQTRALRPRATVALYGHTRHARPNLLCRAI